MMNIVYFFHFTSLHCKNQTLPNSQSFVNGFSNHLTCSCHCIWDHTWYINSNHKSTQTDINSNVHFTPAELKIKKPKRT